MNVSALIERCRILGATFVPYTDWVKVRAPAPLPDELIRELKASKHAVLAELKHERRRENDCWLLEQWRNTAIPEWRRILHMSAESNDTGREEYARWMLKEVLKDPDYPEDA